MTEKETTVVDDRRVRAAQRVMNQANAEKAVKAALAKATELGTSMSVAVVDESGTLVYFVKGDATGLHTFETAWGGSRSLAMAPGAGGYPLTRDGVLIGAIGCGGGIGDHDEQCAETGARAVNS